MAIRFHCTQCDKPIEIDDEWADKPVACPFCRATVTAPSTSTIVEEGDAGSFQATSDGSADDGSADEFVSDPQLSPDSASSGNTAAVVSLVLAVMVIALFIAVRVVVAQYAVELEAFGEDFEALANESSSMLDASMKYADSHGGQLPRWLLLIGLLQAGMLACAVIGGICGIIALRKQERRAMAACSLTVCGFAVLLMCSGMFG